MSTTLLIYLILTTVSTSLAITQRAGFFERSWLATNLTIPYNTTNMNCCLPQGLITIVSSQVNATYLEIDSDQGFWTGNLCNYQENGMTFPIEAGDDWSDLIPDNIYYNEKGVGFYFQNLTTDNTTTAFDLVLFYPGGPLHILNSCQVHLLST